MKRNLIVKEKMIQSKCVLSIKKNSLLMVLFMLWFKLIQIAIFKSELGVCADPCIAVDV